MSEPCLCRSISLRTFFLPYRVSFASLCIIIFLCTSLFGVGSFTYAQQLSHETVLQRSPVERSMFTLYQTQGWTYLRDLQKDIEQKKMIGSLTQSDRHELERLQYIYQRFYDDYIAKGGTFGSTQPGVLSDAEMAKILPQHFTPSSAGGRVQPLHSVQSSSQSSTKSSPRSRRLRNRVVVNDASFYGAGPVVPHVPQDLPRLPHDDGVIVNQSGVSQLSVSQSFQRVFPFDERVLQDAWMIWVNEVRAHRGLPLYIHSVRLEATAQDWTATMRQKGVADHKRTASSKYYDFKEIEQWFGERGVTFERIGRSLFTENVGWARLDCQQPGLACTQVALASLRTIFDYFAAEEFATTNRAHWETMIHPTFVLVGVGIDYDSQSKRLYMSSHHGHQLQ